MNRSSEKEAREQAGAGPSVVDLRDRVPALDNAALASLHANALRLRATGTARQKAAADDLIPVIEAELEARAALKRASPARKQAARKAKAAPAADPEDSADAGNEGDPEPL